MCVTVCEKKKKVLFGHLSFLWSNSVLKTQDRNNSKIQIKRLQKGIILFVNCKLHGTDII